MAEECYVNFLLNPKNSGKFYFLPNKKKKKKLA